MKRNLLIGVFIFMTFINSLIHNVLSLTDLRPAALQGNPLIQLSYWIGWDTTWSMFSPVPRSRQWIEWEARGIEGNWTRLHLRNLSPEDRSSRGWLNKVFDVKLAQQQSVMVNHPEAREHYATRLCRITGALALRAVLFSTAIPSPEQAGGLASLGDQPVNKVFDQRIFECP